MQIDDTTLFIVGQGLVVLGTVVATYVKTQVAITKLQVLTEHLTNCYDRVHEDLAKQRASIHTLSARLEHMEALQQAACSECPLNRLNVKRGNI